jgi:hypothetical protein
MSNSNSSTESGFGIGTILFLIFLVLKLTHTIDWSWWWVTCPIWSVLGFALLCFALAGVLLIIGKKRSRR